MDKWIEIILEAEDMWRNSAEALLMARLDSPKEEYRWARDTYKARRIYDMYGYDYFVKFVERCPHISDLINEYLPCASLDAQCTMFCILYQEGRCVNA